MADWIGVFRAYADHVLSILELDLGQTYRDQMETLYAILSSVLMDYRDAVRSKTRLTCMLKCILWSPSVASTYVRTCHNVNINPL